MTHKISQDLFQKAAEDEGGLPVSVGARVAHVRLAMESGRAVVIDLSGVPENDRPALVAEIRQLVRHASTESLPSTSASASQAN